MKTIILSAILWVGCLAFVHAQSATDDQTVSTEQTVASDDSQPAVQTNLGKITQETDPVAADDATAVVTNDDSNATEDTTNVAPASNEDEKPAVVDKDEDEVEE